MSTPNPDIYSGDSDVFGNIFNNLSQNFSDQQSREKIEDIAVMLGSVAVAEAIPGVGEVQMALQFIDMIDPYGYNQALDRDTLDRIMATQFDKITDMQQSVQDCYVNGTADSCTKAGISADALAAFQKKDPSFQQKQLKGSTSWLTPYPPEVKYPQMYLCTLSHDPGRIQQYCNDSMYKKDYLDYFNANAPAYEKNAAEAAAAAAQQMANGLSGDGSQDQINTKRKRHIKMVLISIWIIVVILVFLMLKKIVPL